MQVSAPISRILIPRAWIGICLFSGNTGGTQCGTVGRDNLSAERHRAG